MYNSYYMSSVNSLELRASAIHRVNLCIKWGRYHQEQSSQLITLKSQIFPVKNANLRSSGLVGLVAKSSVFKPGQFL